MSCGRFRIMRRWIDKSDIPILIKKIVFEHFYSHAVSFLTILAILAILAILTKLTRLTFLTLLTVSTDLTILIVRSHQEQMIS